MKRVSKTLAAILPTFVLAAGLTVTAHAADKVVKIDGSSTVFPITEAVAEDFQKAKKGAIKVTVGISGTGGGFKKLCRGEIDLSGASRPILKKEMEACKQAGIQYIELPVAYDALTVVVNPKNDWLKSITVDELKKMWEPGAQGQITTWKQVNPAWPDTALKLFGPGADSGTFDYFTEAVVGKAKSSRGDFTASEDDNVLVQGVSRDKGALGYFGYAYYAENMKKLKAVPIVEKAGKKPVLPSMETVKDGTYQPLARPIFIYVNAKSVDKPEVKEFVDYYLNQAPKLTKAVKYVPLPDKAYALAKDNFKKKKTGTGFGGEPEVGVSVEDLLKREGKH
jgi:phosphate transport system substrate-binding protein